METSWDRAMQRAAQAKANYSQFHQTKEKTRSKLRTATYTAAVCKFRGGLLVWFRVWHSSAQPLIICAVFLLQPILGCLRRAHPPQ